MKQYEYFVSLIYHDGLSMQFKDVVVVMDELIQSSGDVRKLKKKIGLCHGSILNFQLLGEFESEEKGGE